MDDAGIAIVSEFEMTEKFNNYFASVFTFEDTSNIPEAEQMFEGPTN